MIVLRCYLFALSLLFAPCCLAQGVSLAPEAESGRSEKGLVIAHKDMVVAAHPLAAEAGREMLRKGGSGYLPHRIAAPHLAAGLLHIAANAPVFQRPVYVVENAQAVQNWLWYPEAIAALSAATS